MGSYEDEGEIPLARDGEEVGRQWVATAERGREPEGREKREIKPLQQSVVFL